MQTIVCVKETTIVYFKYPKKKLKFQSNIVCARMSPRQLIFSSCPAISQSKMLQRMMELQMEIEQLKVLCLQQSQKIVNYFHSTAKPNFESEFFFRSCRHPNGERYCVVLDWPEADFLWWGKNDPAWIKINRDLWYWFDRPPDSVSDT